MVRFAGCRVTNGAVSVLSDAAILMVAVSVLMVSNLRYPTFKEVDWTLQRSVAAFAAVVVIALMLALYFQVTLAALFVIYLLYGLVRPWISKRWRREIEVEENYDESPPA